MAINQQGEGGGERIITLRSSVTSGGTFEFAVEEETTWSWYGREITPFGPGQQECLPKTTYELVQA